MSDTTPVLKAAAVQVRVWDVTSGSEDGCLSGHKDYVRCLATSPANSSTLASGVC